MKKTLINSTDKLAVATIYREDIINYHIESNSPFSLVYNDRHFQVKQWVYSFLYRYNFLNPKRDYVYAFDDTDRYCIKVAVNMSQMFRDNLYLYGMLLKTFSDDRLDVFEDLFGEYAPFRTSIIA